MQASEITQNNLTNCPPPLLTSTSKGTFRTSKRSNTTVVPLLRFISQSDNKCSDKEIPANSRNGQINLKQNKHLCIQFVALVCLGVSFPIHLNGFYEKIFRQNNLSEDEDDDNNSDESSFECYHDIWESTNNDLALRGIDLDRQIDKNEQPFNTLRLFKARSGQFRTLRENLSLEQAATQLRVLYNIAMEGRVKKKKLYPTFEDFVKNNQCSDNTDYTKSGISTVLFERFRDYYVKYKNIIAKKKILSNLFQNNRTGAFSRSPRKKMTIEMFMNPEQNEADVQEGAAQKNNQDDSPQKGLIRKSEKNQKDEEEDVYQLSPQLVGKKSESPILRKKQIILAKYPNQVDQQQLQEKQSQQQQNLHKKQPSLLVLEQILQDKEVNNQAPQNNQSSLECIPLETGVTSSVSPQRPTTRSKHQRIITCKEIKSLSQTNLDDSKYLSSPRIEQKPNLINSKVPPPAANFQIITQRNQNNKLSQPLPLPLQFQKQKSQHSTQDTVNGIGSLQSMENNTLNFVAFQKKNLKEISETNIKRYLPKERNSDIIKTSFMEKNTSQDEKQQQKLFTQQVEEFKRSQEKQELQEFEERQQQPESLSPLRYLQKQNSTHNTNRSIIQKMDSQIVRLNQNKTRQSENFTDSCEFQSLMEQQQSGVQNRLSIWEQDNNSSSPIKKKQRIQLSNQLTSFNKSNIPTDSAMLKVPSQFPFNRGNNISNNNNNITSNNHIVEPSSLSGAAARNRRLYQAIFPQNKQPFSMTNIMNQKIEKTTNDYEFSNQKRNLCSLSFIPDEKIEKPIIPAGATGVGPQNNFPSPLKNRLKLLETQSKTPNFMNQTHSKGFQGDN